MTLITLEAIGLGCASVGAAFAALGVLRGALARRADPWTMLDRRHASAQATPGTVCLTVALLLWIVAVAALSLHVTGA